MILRVTTWNPLIARGTRKTDEYGLQSLESLYEYASWQIMLHKEALDHHYMIGIQRCWEKKDYRKLLEIWKFASANNSNDIGLILEWKEPG